MQPAAQFFHAVLLRGALSPLMRTLQRNSIDVGEKNNGSSTNGFFNHTQN